MADIKTFDLNLLRVLDALLDERSVSKAAVRLNLTQSTVSGLLARLREALGDTLFVRRQRGMMPTPRALALAEPVKALLQNAARILEGESFDPARSERTFAIAATDYAQYALLGPMVAFLEQTAPNVRLAFIPTEPARIEREMSEGRLDLWLTQPEDAQPRLRSRELYKERYVGAVRADHPIEGPRLSLAQFCRLRHVIISPDGGGFSGPTDAALAATGRQRRVIVSANSFAVVPHILKSSDMIAVLPERLVRDRSDLKLLTPPIAIAGFTMIAAWHERFQRDPAHVWFRENLARIARGR
jgi:DNA-binding transcriptional LysR family regulator